MGSAGNSRFKAVSESSQWNPIRRVSRREGVGDALWADALADPAIAAIAISTENTDHAPRVRQALAVGKHVLCDYPLAFSKHEAESLAKLATEKNRVLHVEHIALLSEEHAKTKQQLSEIGNVNRGDYLFQGGWNEKLFNPEYSGPHPFLAISRLVQIMDWLGPFEMETRRFSCDRQHFFLHLHLHFPGGGVLGFTEERREGLPRRRSLQVKGSAGEVVWKGGQLGGKLFAKDIDHFYQRITQGEACYYSEPGMREILGALEKVAIKL